MHYYVVSNQVGPKFIKGENNGQELFFSGGIVQLGIIQSSVSIVDNLKYPFFFLPQHFSDHIVTGIAH